MVKAGRYRIIANHTLAFDYGIIQFSHDGQKLGDPLDFHNSPTLPRLYPLGSAELTAGNPVFTTESVGSNPRAKSRHMRGLDYLRLVPTEQ